MDQKQCEAIQAVKNKYCDWLMSLNNVHSVAIGYKETDGKETDEPAIIVFTTKKEAKKNCPKNEQVPAYLDGIPTDVIELPKFETYQAEQNEVENREKFRPIPGGAEIYMPNSPFTGGLCTLGMFVRSIRAQDNENDIYLLANAHCFPRPDQSIFQPESHETQDLIAYASRTVNSELVDGGIARMLYSGEAKTNEIIGIGAPLGSYELTMDNIGDLVIKSGRTTGTTIGKIAYLYADADEKRNQIIIADVNTAFSDHGDSGSVVLMQEGEYRHHVIGLLWGGALNYTILSPIFAVCDELQVSLITNDNNTVS